MPQSMGEIEYEHNPKHQERLPKKKERKWTLGSLFRRKKVKESDSESSDSDAVEDGKKGGFLARRRRRRKSANRGSKDVSQSFEHVILRPGPGNISSDSSRKSLKARVEANRDSMLKGSSSEEECSPRPRVPRSKRSSRDMTDCSIKVLELDSSPRSPRWTAKVVYCESSDYEARYTAHTRSATPSPAQSPVAKVKHFKRPPIPQANQPRPLHCQKSASFDILPRQTQLYNSHGLQPQLRVPPPPPPRDPQRKIIPPLGYQQDRPLSYAFESNQPTQKILTDHNSNITAYKINSTQSLDQPVYKVNSSGSLDQRRMYQYYTDQQPRSRRPIHIARIDQPYLSDSQVGRIRPNDWRLPSHSNSSLCDSSDSREGSNNVNDIRPLSMVVETVEQPLPLKRQPQEILSNGFNKSEQKRKSSNLEDALNELEAIYKSLQLRDEDPPSRGFESDSGYSYRVLDDMAYRRLNRKESGGSPDCRAVMSQAGSYLLVSPTLSPPPFANASPVITQPQNEPDITLDDVVYRNIRHTNNTLKISDPQPPFGIPLGPITPAPNSDYLHATPKQLYRPTFKPRKTPDVVKDDLAYRNLRKDSQNDSLLTCEDNFLGSTNDNSSSILKKKRAVRSLSANLLSIIQKEHFNLDNQNSHVNHNYNNGINFEKTQSFTDLPEVLNSRYKRNSSNAEDSDVTPRVSRLYNELPVSTTSTETLTDSRANIMNTHESFLNGKPSQPINNKSLPKTDYLNQRLPNSHEISSPNKFLQNVQHDNNNEFSVRNSSVEKYMQQFSSPNNSLKFNSYLTQPDSSKPQSSYHSDSNILFSNCKEKDYQLPYDYLKDNTVPTRISNDNLITYDRDYLQRKENERFSQLSYDNDRYFSDDNYNKFIRYGSHDSSDQRIPKVFDHNVNDIRYNSDCDSLRKSVKSNVNSPSSSFTKKTNDAIPNSSFDIKLSIPYLCKPIERDNPSILMTSTEASKSGNHLQTTKGDKVLKKETNSAVKDVSKKPSANSSTKNRISIEGIKIEALPSSKNKSLAKNRFSSLPDEKVQKSGESSTSSLNKSKPKMSHSHEKSHQKIDGSVNINQNKSNNKVVVPRPRSSINITNENSLTVDKNKTPSPNSRLSVTPENESNKKQIPSPRLNLSDKEIKSKSKSPSSSSSSPRLTVRSSSLESNINVGSTKKSSPRISITPEKSPGRTTSESDAGTSKEKDKSVSDSSDRSNRMLKNSSNDKKKRKILSKSLSLNDGLIREINDIDDMKTCIPEIVLDEPSNIEVSSDISYGFISNDNNNITNTKSVHDKESDEVKPNSNVISTSAQNESLKNLQPSRVEKDLNELITEIHHKQDEILAGSKAVSNSPENTTSESLLIGKMKITPHKPVKLTTFSINDNNNTIENNETIIVSDYKENDIIGTSESMTDLLRELTRSLDQDFGILTSNCNTNDDDNYNEDYDVNNDKESVDIDKITNKNITDNEQDVTDEADIEVMEINRKVLSEIEKQNDDKSKDLNKINDNINFNEKSIIDSDDSNMEFVEEICKTASELSALSSTATKSSSQPATNETNNSLTMMDKLRIWNQQPSTSTSNLVDQQNKGESSLRNK